MSKKKKEIIVCDCKNCENLLQCLPFKNDGDYVDDNKELICKTKIEYI